MQDITKIMQRSQDYTQKTKYHTQQQAKHINKDTEGN